MSFRNLPISWKNLIGFMQIVFKNNILHSSFVVVESNRNLPFSHFKLLCIFPSEGDRTGYSYQSSSFFFFFFLPLFGWVKGELCEFLYMSLAYSTEIMDRLFWGPDSHIHIHMYSFINTCFIEKEILIHLLNFYQNGYDPREDDYCQILIVQTEILSQ